MPAGKVAAKRVSRGPSKRILTVVVLVLCLGILITSLNIYELRKMQMDHYGHGGTVEASAGEAEVKQPIYVVHGKKVNYYCKSKQPLK